MRVDVSAADQNGVSRSEKFIMLLLYPNDDLVFNSLFEKVIERRFDLVRQSKLPRADVSISISSLAIHSTRKRRIDALEVFLFVMFVYER